MPISDQKLAAHLETFEQAVDGDEWHETRLQKKQDFPELLSEDRLSGFEEGDVRKLVQNLWAFGNWTDKDYIVDKILQDEIEPVRDQLQTALHETEDRAAAVDALLEVPRFGPAVASEILMFMRPRECGIINRRARDALGVLSYENEIPNRVDSGEDYEDYMAELSSVLRSKRTSLRRRPSPSTTTSISTTSSSGRRHRERGRTRGAITRRDPDNA